MNNNNSLLPQTLDLMEVDDQSDDLLESLHSLVETLDSCYPYGSSSPDRPEPDDAFHQRFILPIVDVSKRLKSLEQRTNDMISDTRIESYARRDKFRLIKSMKVRAIICLFQNSGRTGFRGRSQVEQIVKLCESLISSEGRGEQASDLINNCIVSSRSHSSSAPDHSITYLPLALTSQGLEGLNPLSSSSSSTSSNVAANNFNSNPTTSNGPVGFSFIHRTSSSSSSSSNFNLNPTTTSRSNGPVGFSFIDRTSSSSNNFNLNPTSSSSTGPARFSFIDRTSSSSNNLNSNITASSSPAGFSFTFETRQDANLILNGDSSSNNNALREGEQLETINYSFTGAEETIIEEGLRKMLIIDNGRDDVCAICLEEMKGRDDNNGRATIGCSHTFHFNCILEWARSKHTCPLCRYDINTDKRR